MKIPTLATHSQRLERWLGADAVEGLSRATRDWYGPPIALAGVPGRVFAYGGGDFRGRIDSGRFVNAADMVLTRLRRGFRRAGIEQLSQCGAGFTGIDQIRAALSTGKRRDFLFAKTSGTRVSNACHSLWAVGSTPAAGGNGSAAPGGRACTDATTGGYPYVNPTGGQTLHYLNAKLSASQAGGMFLLYDRLFDVAKTMNSTATEAVTGTPSRYQNTTLGAEDSAEGSFVFPECTTVLPATAHNWTVCQYRNQGNTDNVTLPSITGNSSNAVNRLDMPTFQWFAPLASGDTGIMDLAQMQCSALVASGAINFVIGHPIAYLACPLTSTMCLDDGVLTALDLVRVFDDACLAGIDVIASNTSSCVYNVPIVMAFN